MAIHRSQTYPPRHAVVRVPVPGPPFGRTPFRMGLALAGLLAVAWVGGAGATDAAPHPPLAAPRPVVRAAHALPELPLTPEMLSRGAPRGAKLLPAGPVHVARPAPATKPVITGLAANGIPVVALNAYRVAAARLASADPRCGVGWPLLAAIGRVESDHGRYGGARLYPNGESVPQIIGIALDGSRSAFVRDTDGGRLDRDPRYDHAVGPMQFIPSTWAVWGLDGNGDGVADPFNIDDAALSAARYLCAAGGDLRTNAGQMAAVLAYNDSDQYLAQVLALTRAYAAGVPVGSLPIGGPTSGALPPVTPVADLPVNPAIPPAGAAHVGPARTSAPAAPSSPSSATWASSRGSSPSAAPATPRLTSTAAGPGDAPSSQGGSTRTPPAPAARPTPTPTPTQAGTSPTPRPAPLKTVVNGVLCTVGLLGIPVCPTPTN